VAVPDCTGLQVGGRAGEDGGWGIDAWFAAVHDSHWYWGEVSAVAYQPYALPPTAAIALSYDVL